MDAFLENWNRVEAKVRHYASRAVWRSAWDTSPEPISEGFFTTDPVIRAWEIPKTTGVFLYTEIIKNNSKHILELGTSVGYSTLWLARGVKETGGHIDTVEYFDQKSKLAKSFLKEAGILDLVTVHESEIMPVLSHWNKKIDFVFLDADKSNYGNYFDLILPHLSDKGIIIADNAGNMHGRMKDFFEKVSTHTEFETEFIELDNGLLKITKK